MQRPSLSSTRAKALRRYHTGTQHDTHIHQPHPHPLTPRSFELPRHPNATAAPCTPSVSLCVSSSLAHQGCNLCVCLFVKGVPYVCRTSASTSASRCLCSLASVRMASRSPHTYRGNFQVSSLFHVFEALI